MKILFTSVLVDDQAKALAFYTDVLGFRPKNDVPLGEHRWLTVVSPDAPDGVELVLEPDEHPAAKPFKTALVEDGIPVTSFGVADVASEYERLSALGVHFVQEPAAMGPVVTAVLDDTCGNLLQLTSPALQPVPVRRFVDEDLTGAEFRECDLSRTRLVGVVMQDAEIDGLITNLVVNGVEVTGHVEAELDRLHPVRVLSRSDEPADLREAWRLLRADWTATVGRVRSMPEGSEHESVDGEWSMVQTLRHLIFVHDSWFRRCVLGLTEPFTAIGLGMTGMTVPDLDPDAQPGLDEVLAVRDRQAAEIATWLAEVTPAELARTAPVPDDDRWPPYARDKSVRRCLGTVLNEEWAHHSFCVRDLDKLSS